MAKKLLEEATVRRFQKIAGIRTLNEVYKEQEEQEERMMEEEEMTDEPAPEAPEMEEPEEEMEDEEVDLVDDEMGAEGGMSEDEKVELLQKLAMALGVEVEVEGEEEPEMEEPEMEEPEMEEPEEEMADEPLEEGEHMEGPAKDPAGHSLESLPLLDVSDSKDPNQDGKTTSQDAMKKGQHMAESQEAFKKKLVEQVAKRVAARIKNIK